MPQAPAPFHPMRLYATCPKGINMGIYLAHNDRRRAQPRGTEPCAGYHPIADTLYLGDSFRLAGRSLSLWRSSPIAPKSVARAWFSEFDCIPGISAWLTGRSSNGSIADKFRTCNIPMATGAHSAYLATAL